MTREVLPKYFGGITEREVKAAADAAYAAHAGVSGQRCGQRALRSLPKPAARTKRILVLAGRPYHVDRRSTTASIV